MSQITGLSEQQFGEAKPETTRDKELTPTETLSPESPEDKEMNEMDKICRMYASDLSTCLTEHLVNHITGYPEDMLEIKNGESVYNHLTSPTNIGLYLASIIAMRDMQFMTVENVNQSIDKIMKTLEKAKKEHGDESHGLFYGWYNTETGDAAHLKNGEGNDTPLFLSSVDNAWLAVGLIAIKNASPEHAERANAVLMGMDFKLLYDDKKDLFYNGYYPETEQPTDGHYDVLNSESRIVSNVGINVFTIPLKNYARLGRYAPADREAPPTTTKAYLESWRGSMFEGLLVPQFENKGGLYKQHRAYIKAQIKYGKKHNNGFWGFSSCFTPKGKYDEVGLRRLAMDKEAYGTKGRLPITPHAAFLAMWHMPKAAIKNLERLRRTFPEMYEKGFGFKDSVDTQTGKVGGAYLVLDQTMSLIGLYNYLTDGGMARYVQPDLGKYQEAFVGHWKGA